MQQRLASIDAALDELKSRPLKAEGLDATTHTQHEEEQWEEGCSVQVKAKKTIAIFFSICERVVIASLRRKLILPCIAKIYQVDPSLERKQYSEGSTKANLLFAKQQITLVGLLLLVDPSVYRLLSSFVG